MAIASLRIASTAQAQLATDGHNIYRIKNGTAIRMSRSDIEHYVSSLPKGATITLAKVRIRHQESKWIYTGGDGGNWARRDSDGVLHVFHAQMNTYNQTTREYQSFIQGRWITPSNEGYTFFRY